MSILVLQVRKVLAVRKASLVYKVHQVHQARRACPESQASVDRLENLDDQAGTVVLVPPVLQANLDLVEAGEIAERMALLAHLAQTDHQAIRVARDRMEIQAEKDPVDLVVYLDVAAQPAL